MIAWLLLLFYSLVIRFSRLMGKMDTRSLSPAERHFF